LGSEFGRCILSGCWRGTRPFLCITRLGERRHPYSSPSALPGLHSTSPALARQRPQNSERSLAPLSSAANLCHALRRNVRPSLYACRDVEHALGRSVMDHRCRCFMGSDGALCSQPARCLRCCDTALCLAHHRGCDLRYADGQQLHRPLRRNSQLAIPIQAPPLEDLVRVDTMLQRHPSHRSARHQRLLHNTPTLQRTATPTRPHSQPTTQIYVYHPNIIAAQRNSVHAANTAFQLPTTRSG
jgi:hypothetical protein